MNQKLYFIFLLFTFTSCKGGNKYIEQNKSYLFPNTSIVKSIPTECINKGDDKVINAASGLESFLLDVVADEITIDDEISYGQKFNTIHKKDLEFLYDNRLLQVQTILKKLTKYISRKDITYSITLVNNDSELNAWTHIGGYIYITTALLNATETEDELAFCIAHEIAHNENQHCIASLKKIKTATNFFGSEDLAKITHNIYDLIFAAFNQPQETESDLAAVYLMYMAGYNPERALDFFNRLSINEESNALEKMMRSHPFASERKICLENYLKNAVQ